MDVEREDDPSIGPDELLWRRAPYEWLQRDETGDMRPTSQVFLDRRSGEVSVVLASLADKDRVLMQYPSHSLVEVRAEVVRLQGCILVRDPLPDEPAHALICPPRGQKQLSKTAARIIELRDPESAG